MNKEDIIKGLEWLFYEAKKGTTLNYAGYLDDIKILLKDERA